MSLDVIFKAMSECQALHPDESDEMSDEFDEENDADEIGDECEERQIFSGVIGQGDANLGGREAFPHFDENESAEAMDEDQFEDAPNDKS